MVFDRYGSRSPNSHDGGSAQGFTVERSCQLPQATKVRYKPKGWPHLGPA